MKDVQYELGNSFRDVPEGVDRAIHDAFAAIRSSANEKHRTHQTRAVSKRRVLLLAALITIMLLTVAIAGGLLRSVFQFSERYLVPGEQAALPAAHELAVQNIASWQLDHVRIDVSEAVYDGQELRLVYAITSPSITQLYVDNPEGTLAMMRLALEADGVSQNADGAFIDGQMISWNDEKVETSEIPGQVLFYKRSVLPVWGIDPPKGTFTVSLGLLKGKNQDEQPSFVLDGTRADDAVLYVQPSSIRDNGLTIALTGGRLTAMSGTLELEITLDGSESGQETARAASKWLEGNNLFTKDGEALTGGIQGYDPEQPILNVTLLFDPPKTAGNWGELLYLRPIPDDTDSEITQLEVYAK